MLMNLTRAEVLVLLKRAGLVSDEDTVEVFGETQGDFMYFADLVICAHITKRLKNELEDAKQEDRKYDGE